MKKRAEAKAEPQARRRRLDQLVRKNIPLILAALWDAAEWQDSVNDAHYRSVKPWNRCKKNTAVAARADKQRIRYLKLADRIRGANPTGLRCAGLDAHKQDPVVLPPDSENHGERK